MTRSLAIAIVLSAGVMVSTALAQTVQPPTIPLSAFVTVNQQSNITPPSPAWGTNYGVYNGVTVNVNGFPTNTIFTGGNGSTSGIIPAASALTGAISVPANDTGIFQQDGVSGFAANASGNPAIGLFGWGFQLDGSHLAQNWGVNTGVSNTPYFAPLTSTGFNFNQMYGAEFDVNVSKLPGGATPAGTVFGAAIYGGSEVVPTGGAYGLYVASYNRTGNLGWNAAINIAASPNTFGIVVGPDATTGNNLSSQTLTFAGVNSSGAGVNASLFVNSLGNLISTRAGITEFQLLSGSLLQYSPDATHATTYSTDNAGSSNIITTGNMVVNTGASDIFAIQNNSIAEFQVVSGAMFQYSPDATKITNYSTDNSGNTTIITGAAGATFSLRDSANTLLTTIGNASHGTSTGNVCHDNAHNWFEC